MRILLLTQRFAPAIGGVETHVLNLASWLSKNGESVTVLTTDLRRDIPFERLGRKQNAFPFPVRRFRAVKMADLPHGLGIAAPGMLREVLSSRCDLIHAHGYGFFPTYVAALANLLRDTPLVVTTHSDRGTPTLRKRAFDRVVPLLTLGRAQRIVALTAGEERHLRRLGIRRERISIIPNGVNPEEFAQPPARHPHDGEATILFVGRCYPQQKGLEHLIRAISLLDPAAKVRLRIAGEDWGGVTVIRRLAQSLHVEHLVTFEGLLSRADLATAYSSSDIFVLPSLFEPFGISLLEAMASGLPVVASRVGGIPEVVEEGRTALLVEPGNSRQLADALESLIRDNRLRQSMGERGRERASLYAWDNVVPQIRRVYQEVLTEVAS